MSDPATPSTPPTAPVTTWRDSLPDDLKADATLATVPDVPTLAKNYLATKAMTGKKGYDLPQADWTPEKYKEWGKLHGVPETPDKYPTVEKEVLEKAGLPPELLSAAQAKFHELNVPPWQAKAILDWYAKDAATGKELQAAQRAKEREEGISALKAAWGDKYDANTGLLKAWLKDNADEEFIKYAEESGLGNNPKFVQAIIKSAQKTLESSSRMGLNPGTSFGSPEAEAAAALQKLGEIKARRSTDPAYDKNFDLPNTAERKEYESLLQKAYPTKK